MRDLILFLIISFLAIGCVSAKSSFNPTANRLPIYSGEVRILDRLPEKYIDVGWVHIKENATWIELFRSAKIEAGQHGANAIIYSPSNCKYTRGGMRVIVCQAVYIEEPPIKPKS